MNKIINNKYLIKKSYNNKYDKVSINKELSCKVFQLGLKSYTNKHSSIYKSKVSSFSPESFNRLNHKGLEVIMKGRLKGVRRARKLVLKEGTVSKNSLRKRLDCSNFELKTKTGILNLQVNIGRWQ